MTCLFRGQVKRKLFEERNENSTRQTETVLLNRKDQSQRQYSSKAEQPFCGQTSAQGVGKALRVTVWRGG